MFKDMKLRHKVLVTYAFVGILPIAVLGCFCYNQSKNMLVEHENSNMQDCLDQAVLSIDNQLDIYNNLSDYIAYNQSIGQVISYDYSTAYEIYEKYENLTNILDPMLASLKYFHSKVNQITIYTSNNFVKHDTTVAPLSTIVSTEWYKKVTEQSNRDTLWFVKPDQKKVFTARKMPTLEGTDYPSVLYIEVDYNDLFSPLMDMTSSDYGIYVVDQNNSVVYSHNKFSKDSKEYAMNYDTLLDEMENENVSQYTIVKDQVSSGWEVLLYKPNSAIMSSVRNIALISVVVTLCCIVASLLAAAGISKFMVTDIEKLTENMKNVQTGNLEITVTSNSKDEVGNLIRGFGMMIERIHLLINEVYEGEIAQKEYEMKALQAQINPHFLYNSLSLINWKAIEANKQDISRITLLLSTFYRTALNRGDNILSVRDEITNMKCYLDIQLMMHENNFDVVMDIPEEMYQYQTLNLILQPIVENAIDHGIDLLTDRRGVISIKGEQSAGTISFIVEDNGVGMDEEKAQTILTKKSKGYGIRNVNERIKLLYGYEYCMQVHSEVGVGTRITVVMPAIKVG
ncbi:MAG: sensor histidine kinase [bacterium]|nr:sensor histidine kinase [bacterium]